MNLRDKLSGFWHVAHVALALLGLAGWWRMAHRPVSD